MRRFWPLWKDFFLNCPRKSWRLDSIRGKQGECVNQECLCVFGFAYKESWRTFVTFCYHISWLSGNTCPIPLNHAHSVCVILSILLSFSYLLFLYTIVSKLPKPSSFTSYFLRHSPYNCALAVLWRILLMFLTNIYILKITEMFSCF